MMYNLILLGLLNSAVQGDDVCKCGYKKEPVCSRDGEQFDNPCLAKCHGVEDWTDGECPKIPTLENICVLQSSKEECEAVAPCAWSSRKERCSFRVCKCGLDWQPVCSGDGDQFDNPCLAKCHGVEDWTEGECPKIPTLENICILQSSKKECKAIAACAWSSRKERCSFRTSRETWSAPASQTGAGGDAVAPEICGHPWSKIMFRSKDVTKTFATNDACACEQGCVGEEAWTWTTDSSTQPGVQPKCWCLNKPSSEIRKLATWHRRYTSSYLPPTPTPTAAPSAPEYSNLGVDCGCGLDWQPVCSGDGEQFDNPCLAKCHGVKAWTEGECKACRKCGLDWQPVCSGDGEQFDNPCLAKCHGVKDWTEGECQACRKCGLDWQPVCSGDGEQFDNPCLAKCHGVDDFSEGECSRIPTLENICVLQSSRKECQAVAACVWSSREERCSFRTAPKARSAPVQTDCECGLDWQPVCSGDGEQFDNPCLAKCHGVKDWTDGECQADCVCPYILQPVCSDDMRQFANLCLAKCHGVKTWTEGKCPMIQDVCDLQRTRKDCRSLPDCTWSNRKGRCSYRNTDCGCGLDWQPVCSGDGEQFDNPCLAECHGVEDWTEGECQADCVCPYILQPVCSDDMRQFANPCLAQCHGIEDWTEGECPMIQDVCDLQRTRDSCRSIPACAWSNRDGRCSYRIADGRPARRQQEERAVPQRGGR